MKLPVKLRAVLRGVGAAYAPGLVDRFPPVRVRLGPWVPAWAVRLASAAAATGCLGVVSLSGSDLAVIWWGFAVGALLLVLWPARLLPALVVLTIGAIPVLTLSALSTAQLAALILGLPLVAMLGALGGQVGFSARIELATLVPLVRRLAVIQLVAQPIGLLAGLLTGAPIGLSLLPVLAVAGLAVLVILWVPTLRSE